MVRLCLPPYRDDIVYGWPLISYEKSLKRHFTMSFFGSRTIFDQFILFLIRPNCFSNFDMAQKDLALVKIFFCTGLNWNHWNPILNQSKKIWTGLNHNEPTEGQSIYSFSVCVFLTERGQPAGKSNKSIKALEHAALSTNRMVVCFWLRATLRSRSYK